MAEFRLKVFFEIVSNPASVRDIQIMNNVNASNIQIVFDLFLLNRKMEKSSEIIMKI